MAPAGKRRRVDLASLDSSTLATKTRQELIDIIAEIRDSEAEGSRKKTQGFRESVVKGIKSLLTWKPSCTSGTAKFCYHGTVPSPSALPVLLGLPPDERFKNKRFSKDEFEQIIGKPIEASVRYDTLSLTKNVNVHWNKVQGTFSISGTYGKYQFEVVNLLPTSGI